MRRGRRQSDIAFLPFHYLLADLWHFFRKVRDRSPLRNREIAGSRLQRFEQRFFFTRDLSLKEWRFAVCLPKKESRCAVRIDTVRIPFPACAGRAPRSAPCVTRCVGCRFHRDCRGHFAQLLSGRAALGRTRPCRCPPQARRLGPAPPVVIARPRWLAPTSPLPPGGGRGPRKTITAPSAACCAVRG